MGYNTGDVVVVKLEDASKAIGHEQANTRPCVVIRPMDALGLAIVVPCTTALPSSSSFVYVKLRGGTAGLTKESYALCHQIRTVSYRRLNKSILGKLTGREIGKVKQVLLDLLDL
jgi:mRNA interferase MazF